MRKLSPNLITPHDAGMARLAHAECPWLPIVFILSFILVLVGCSPKPLPSGGIITSSGEYAPADQSWKLTVAADGQYQVHTAPHIAMRPDWQPKLGWFFFIEDAKHLWTFDGESQLYVLIWADDGSIGRYDLTSYKGAVPDSVLRASSAARR